MQTTFNIKTETADAMRTKLAPALGLKPSARRNIVAPGVEVMELDPFTAMRFETERKRAKIGVDAMIMRIIKRVGVPA